MIQFVHSKEEFDLVLTGAGAKLVVVDFTAIWYGPCHMIAPILETLAHDNPDVVFIKVDVNQLPEVSASYGVRAMPTIIFIKNGQKVSEIPGADLGRLLAEVAQHK